MTYVVIGLLVLFVLGFAISADHWRREYLTAMDGWREALRNNEEALRLLAEYDMNNQQLIGEVDSAVLRVWAVNN